MSTRQQPKTKRLMNWLLRSLLVVGQQPRGASQGFVLPTVVMVTLVVVLLTTAMILRSFDRSKNASNFRVNETVLNATSPALDRARAKIDGLFADPALPRGTPSETEMYNAIATKERYTFGDETRLKVAFDIDGGGISTAATALQNQEVVTTAWRFPVDTDNNGKFDSYTLYGVYLRSPSVGTDGNFNRARNSLEARSAPMVDDRILNANCKNAFGGATTSTFLSSTGWYRVNDVLKKSFFVYAATVPLNSSDAIVSSNSTRYEAYKGNKGFSALELQQDRSRIPIYNAAVLYEDDLEIAPGPNFNLNGRVFTNSNLLTGEPDTGNTQFFLVSGSNSCYIKSEDNSKIVVGGNATLGNFLGQANSRDVQVDLYQGNTIANSSISTTNKSATDASNDVAYNSQAYADRIDFLVRSAIAKGGTQTTTGSVPNLKVNSGDPDEVKNNIASRKNSDESLDLDLLRQEEMERYFKKRTRRVPYKEVPFGTSFIGSTVGTTTIADTTPADGIADVNQTVLVGSGNDLRPPDTWAVPTGTDGITSTGYTGLTLTGTQLPMTDLDTHKNQDKKQDFLLGDRILVGNNLPALRYLVNKFVGQEEGQTVGTATWTRGQTTQPRKRFTRIETLPDLGVTNRNGFWEKAATDNPVNALDNVGGLRVITGAGIYHIPGYTSAITALNTDSWFDHSSLGTPNPMRTGNLATGEPAPLVSRDTSLLAGTVGATDRYKVVWPDSMPMSGGDATAGAPPDLRMRATAVYHYKNKTGIDQTPLACISSYYDPTNATTAKNTSTWNNATGGMSNNGIVYPPPYTTPAARLTTAATNIAELKAQATLVFPNGRIVNEQLQNALKKLTSAGALSSSTNPLTLAENAAIDTAICAIKIVDGTASPSTSPSTGFTIPHGAIRETTFLDARQLRAVDGAANLSSISAGSSTTSARTYTMSNTGSLKAGDVVTISGFKTQPELNVTRATISSVTANTSITVLGGTSAAIASTSASAKVVEALTGNYDLALEERQPLEVRATVIDLAAIKTSVSGSSPPEYLFPNSGIIYASRDDALQDLSAPRASSSEQDKAAQRLKSPVDYRLDPSRRPSAILLENGSSLGRESGYRPEEKGLVLATDLPVYIKGDFNLHTQEEFTTAMTAGWANFYGRTGINDNFACRVGQYAACDTGDPWRPATVLADAITPLSSSYNFGFRSDGDYDLNNNVGAGEAIAKRLTNGFWNNSFVTSRNFQDADYSVSTGSGTNSSYFNNFVTPIQRRGDFPEYVMEICRKLPVSECQPKDWVVGYDVDANGTLTAAELSIKASSIPIGTPAASLLSGTTARPALRAADQRYPRRIAFKRAANGSLKFTTTWANDRATPIPFGIRTVSSVDQVDEIPYDTYSTKSPKVASNALWFRTTTNTVGLPFCEGASGDCTADNRTYENDQPLYYMPNFNTASPPTPEIPGVPSLNLPEANPASSYTVCTDGNTNGSSKKLVVGSTASGESGKCSDQTGNPMDAINATRNALIALTPGVVGVSNTVAPTRTGTTGAFPPAAGTTTKFTDPYLSSTPPAAGNVINVIELGAGDFTTSTTCTKIQLEGNENSIFVLKRSGNSALNFGDSSGNPTHCGVQVELIGVDPNNVFWAVNANISWNQVSSASGKTHIMTGTFLTDNTGTPKWETVVFDGGRLLGPNGVPSSSNFTPGTTKVIAIGSNGQPLLAPVLQIQVPAGAPANDATRVTSGANLNLPNVTGIGNQVRTTKWLAKASGATTFNLVAGAGDTPARPAEDNGGLHNFLRFLETWNATEVKAFGSFVQYKRSVFATAPFQPLLDTNTSTGLFGYPQIYKAANGGGKLPFYEPPDRNWGFDVALLKQRRPDLLAERFSTEPIFSANEFFRETSRDDKWVQSLLCAKTTGTTPVNAINDSERPANCPTGTW